MIENSTDIWVEKNQQHLSASMLLMRNRLELYKARLSDNKPLIENKLAEISDNENLIKQLVANIPSLPALEMLANIFGLSSFEKDCIVVCAGIELDSAFSNLVAELHGNTNAFLPSFSLMLAALPNAHWSAISPNAPLRYWRMIELNSNSLVSKSPIKIDEHILHYLAGVNELDERLAGIVEIFSGSVELVASHIELSNQIINFCLNNFNKNKLQPLQLVGDSKVDKNNIAAYVCRSIGCNTYTISANILPNIPKEIIELARFWNREAALKSYALILDFYDVDINDKQRIQSINLFINNIHGLLIINTQNTRSNSDNQYRSFDVLKPTTDEQFNLWKDNLENSNELPDTEFKKLVAQFNFSIKTIKDASKEIAQLPNPQVNGNFSKQLLQDIWSTCCIHSRPVIGELAQRIEPIAHMNDLVLSDAQKDILEDIIIHTKYRSQVYDDWGFAKRNNRGLGITVLFSGESGTGKTMASEVLANELKLDLYRIDLSQVINKYIGETEKNLKKIFDAAEDGGAILLFDEADALFGKRSEVKDSHDRYANVEVSYLLQRMEAYRGLAILTTNMKSTMDKAWMRRIRFVVQFPFPDVDQRVEIWKRVFPSQTPVHELDSNKLGRLNIAGGNIKNIAMNAAFIAAAENDSIRMQHIQRALRSEYEKMEKPLTNAEINLIK